MRSACGARGSGDGVIVGRSLATASQIPPRGRTKAPEGTGGDLRSAVLWLRTSPQSQSAAGSLARRPCDLRTWFPGPSGGSLLRPVWRFNLPLRARRRLRAHPSRPQWACPRICREIARTYPRPPG
jgi:hypothetical protein